MKTLHFARTTLTVALLAILPSLVMAQSRPTELRLATGAPPAGNPWATQVNRLAKDVEEESKGDLKIQVYLGAQLGSEQDTVQQVARGRIDMGVFSSGSASLLVPEIGLLVMPMYFASVAEQDCLLDNHLGKLVGKLFEKKGVQFLGFNEVGTYDLWGKKPYTSPKDLEGVKAATAYNKTQQLFYSENGGYPNPLALPEFIPAYQTGLAEVSLLPITYALPTGLSKIATVATRGFYTGPGFLLMNKRTYDKLSPEQRDSLSRAIGRSPYSKARTEIREFESTLFAMYEKAGGKAITLTPEQRAVWRKSLEPVYAHTVKETSGDSASFYAQMEAGIKACRK